VNGAGGRSILRKVVVVVVVAAFGVDVDGGAEVLLTARCNPADNSWSIKMYQSTS
jgi:hypothetical protein